MKNIYSTIAACLIVCAGWSQTRYIDNMFEVVKTSDIVYGTGLTESLATVNLSFDLYTPQGDTKTDRPLIIVAHQGSFIEEYGDKTDAYMVDYATAMAKKGFVVACINYREGWAFSPLNTQEQNSRAILPAVWRAIQDYKNAIRYFRKSVAAMGNPYGIREDLIIGGGFGAGGYLPLNGMLLDVPSEIFLPELRQKNAFGQPTSVPYIDTTKADLGGIFSQAGGNAGYSFRTDLVLNFSGAIPTPKIFDSGKNPLVISVHSTEDEATPYKTAIVRAAGIFAVIEVSGSYVVSNELYERGINNFWEPENRDGFPQVMIDDEVNGPLNMYSRGLYTFLGRPYMWSTTTDTYNATYETQYKAEMDTVIAYSAYRIQRWLGTKTGIEELTAEANNGLVEIFPNPSSDVVTLQSTRGQLIREVELVDAQGRTIKSYMVINGDARLDLSSLPAGVYAVKIYFDDKIVTDRLIRQ